MTLGRQRGQATLIHQSINNRLILTVKTAPKPQPIGWGLVFGRLFNILPIEQVVSIMCLPGFGVTNKPID